MIRKVVPLVLMLMLLTTSFTAIERAKPALSSRYIHDTGIVKKVEYKEKTLYVIIGDRGTFFRGRYYKIYLPVNLPGKFRRNGLSVEFLARIYIPKTPVTRGIRDLPVLPVWIIKIKTLERIRGLVYDQETGKSLSGVKVVVERSTTSDDKWVVLDKCISRRDGTYELKHTDLDLEVRYRIRAFKRGFKPFIKYISPIKPGSIVVYNILLEREKRITIDYPHNGDTVSGLVKIRGSIYSVPELPPITKVWVSIDRGEWREAKIIFFKSNDPNQDKVGIWFYTWDTTKELNGKHRINVRAWDGERYEYEFVYVRVKNRAATAILYGRVVDANTGTPIEGAVVKAYLLKPVIKTSPGNSTVSFVTTTDEKGFYKLKLPAGEYRVEVEKKGYEKQTKYISLLKDDIKRLDFKLKRISPIHLVFPNGGEKLSGIVNISWEIHGQLPIIPLTVSIQYRYGDEKRWVTIVDDCDLRSPYRWDTTEVPDGFPYWVRVILRGDPDLDGVYEKVIGEDTSDGPFAIVNGEIVR